MRKIIISPLLFLPFLLCAYSTQAQNAFELILPELYLTDGERTVVQTPDGGFCVLFRHDVKADDLSHPSVLPGSTCFGLAKISADGLLEWCRYTALDIKTLNPITLCNLPDGGFAVGGTYEYVKGHSLRWDILTMRFNAHGYPTQAISYDIDPYDDLIDCIPLDNGDMIILGSRSFLRVTPDGDIVSAKSIFSLDIPSYRYSRIMKQNAETITLIGSTSLRTNSSSGTLGLLCKLSLDGNILVAQAVDPFGKRVPNFLTEVTDLVPANNGGYFLLGSRGYSMTDGGGESVTFLAAFDSNNDSLWTRNYYGEFIPSALIRQEDGSFVMMSATYKPGGLFIAQTKSDGSLINATSYTISPESDNEENSAILEACTHIRTDDNGILLAGNVFNKEGEPSGARLIRLNPDYSSCNLHVKKVSIAASKEDSYFVESYTDPADAFYERYYDEDEKEETSEELENEEESTFPVITNLDVAASDLEVRVRHHTAMMTTIDLPIEPQIHCWENSLPPVFSTSSTTSDEIVESITLTPNSVRAGQYITVTFRLEGTAFPEVTVLTVATGQTERQIPPGAIHWNASTGRGTATIETTGMTLGTYLVRVRSGEEQMTAKMEVQ